MEPVRPAGAVGWTTTREQFYYVVLAFYCFADEKAAVIENGGFLLISATTLLKKTLFTAMLELTPALQTLHARGMKHVGVLRALLRICFAAEVHIDSTEDGPREIKSKQT